MIDHHENHRQLPARIQHHQSVIVMTHLIAQASEPHEEHRALHDAQYHGWKVETEEYKPEAEAEWILSQR